MSQMQFCKGYLPGWINELFQVTKMFSDKPPYYKIKDLLRQWLEETFYKVTKNL